MHKDLTQNQVVSIKPRAMTWAEKEAFIAAGLDPVYREEEITPRWERDVIKWILDNVYTGYVYDNLSFPQCRTLAFKTYEMTMLAEEEEEKNC